MKSCPCRADGSRPRPVEGPSSEPQRSGQEQRDQSVAVATANRMDDQHGIERDQHDGHRRPVGADPPTGEHREQRSAGERGTGEHLEGQDGGSR